ncbi:MAG: hypothetical protein QOE92_1680 [Chloroflexota bacterium]|jgi:hypothetical protein|nr:hypothetical protein [Chloroflexota bacterium]
MTQQPLSYEERLVTSLKSQLLLWTQQPGPFIDGVQFESIALTGEYPTGSLSLRFRHDEWPGQGFGLRLRLVDWAAPDELDRLAGEPDPMDPTEVADLLTRHLEGHLDAGFFSLPPTAPADKDGVIWLTVARDTELRAADTDG